MIKDFTSFWFPGTKLRFFSKMSYHFSLPNILSFSNKKPKREYFRPIVSGQFAL